MRVINWFEIPVADMARARKFYETVFAITLREENSPNGEMAIFPYTEPNTGGSLAKMDHLTPGPQGPLNYLNAGADLAPILARVEGAGGAILMPKTSIGEHGDIAVFRDSEGNHIGLHSDGEG